MTKKTVIKILVFFFFLLMIMVGIANDGIRQQGIADKKDAVPNNSFIGEKIVYSVKLGAIDLGSAVFTRMQNAELNGKEVNKMTFETRLARFRDTETIYSDLVSFLPVRIVRDINTWTSKENIVEDYDQKNFVLTITKSKGRTKEEWQITKNQPIQNAILLPFSIRQVPDLKPGWNIMVQLPGQAYKIILDSVEELKLPAGKFEAYHFVSQPPHFQIWVSTDSRRIPLKIKGAGVLRYTLVFKEYSLGNHLRNKGNQ